MDLTLSRKDYVELIAHGLPSTELMQLLAGAFESGKALVKHLEISEIDGVDACLARGEFPHEIVAPGAYLFDANVAVTFLSNVHVRRGELTVLPAFPEPGPAREALLGAKELWPEPARAQGALFYAVTPNEDLVSIAARDEAVARRVLVGAVKLATLGRVAPERWEGEEAIWDALAPLAEEPALLVRPRKGDYPGERRAVALGHASQWIRRIVRARLRARKLPYRHPASVTQHEVIAHLTQNRIEVGAPKTIPLRELLGLNRWLFDRYGPVWFFGMLGLFLAALCPASTLVTQGPTAAGVAAVAVLCAASWAVYDMGARD